MNTLLISDFSENISNLPPWSIMLAIGLWYTAFTMMMYDLIIVASLGLFSLTDIKSH